MQLLYLFHLPWQRTFRSVHFRSKQKKIVPYWTLSTESRKISVGIVYDGIYQRSYQQQFWFNFEKMSSPMTIILKKTSLSEPKVYFGWLATFYFYYVEWWIYEYYLSFVWKNKNSIFWHSSESPFWAIFSFFDNFGLNNPLNPRK